MFEEIWTRKRGGLRTTLLFIDMKSAYDRVDRRELIRLVKQKGILNEEQLQLLGFLLSNASTQYGGHSTRMTNGLPQGSTLSPILFDIFIEELSRRLRERGISHRLYADDVIVIGDDDTIAAAIAEIEGWASTTNMRVNKTKSGILAVDGSRLRIGD